MARPLRIESPGAVYHITSRGNAKSAIFIDDLDRITFLESLESTVTKYNWFCHAYCLMGNHYHLLIETIDPNLSLGMRQLNGVHTQAFNRHHNRVGHVFQGRFKSILVEKESYLLELCRYIVRNPLRARMVQNIADWKWSSYHATATGINKQQRNEGMAQAHLQHGYTLKEIGNHLGLHYSTVSRGVVANTKIR